jgi:hypothetical protein
MGDTNLLPDENSECLVKWFQNRYVCADCSTEWTDEWSCKCDDRCPECDTECCPIESIDLSRPLTEDDYEGARREIASISVTAEQARYYAEARLEGR